MLALAPLYTHRPAQNRFFYFALFIMLVSASFSDYFAAMPAMNSMLALAGIATALFWLVERSFKLGYLFGTFVTGGGAVRAFLEHRHHPRVAFHRALPGVMHTGGMRRPW